MSTVCNGSTMSEFIQSFIVQHIDINVDHKTLCEWKCTKFLGLNFDENLSWKPHSERLISKLNSVCYQIRILRPVIGLESLLSFYYAQVESRLVYGISFWGSGSMLGDIFIAQKRVLRCMAGVDNRTSCRNIFLRFNVLTVYGLYILKILNFVHSNISDINKNSDYHSYNTRHRNDMRFKAP